MPKAQRAFYASLCNWEIGDGPVMQIPAGIGGPEPGPGGHLRQSDRSRVTLSVEVRDRKAALVKATELGATVVVERFDPLRVVPSRRDQGGVMLLNR
jgi:hypothetical protein